MHAEFAGYPATAAWIASTLSGVPFSFSAHAHDIFLSQLGLVRKAQDAAFVRTISEFNRRFLAALPGFPAEKISVMRCGVELCKPAPVPPRAGMPADPWRLLFVGALLPRKGVDDLIAAVALLPETLHWRLDIIGGGRLEQALRNQVRALGLAQVAFHGAQPAQTVGAAMQAAHLVVVPSKVGDGGRSEGIPVVLMEALAQARPVVASRLSGIPELIKDGITGRLCRPGSPSELAQTITETLGDWPGALEMGARGRDRVVRDYDITQNAQALLDKITSEPAPC
jgi:glycosyltransferase involved in cell wall biosynthesis